MSSKPVRDAVGNFLAANWLTTPIVAVNNVFPTPPSLEPWIAVQFVTGAEAQASLGDPGNNVYRETGTIFVHIVVPAGTGDALALTYAEELRTLFRNARFDGVHCLSADPPNTEPGTTVVADDGAWFGASFAVDYEYDSFA
jgi:hypothetical protein